MEKGKEFIPQGLVYAPYIPMTVSTSINGETVWYKNKWKNFLLKIKFFFVKPRYLKHVDRYANKPVNPKFYGKIEITKPKDE